jgi:hypothetical protein
MTKRSGKEIGQGYVEALRTHLNAHKGGGRGKERRENG